MMPVLLLVLATSPDQYEAEIEAAIADAREVFEVPASLVKAVIHTESAFNPRAFSKVGAIGLMQLMPFNAAKLGITEAELWNRNRSGPGLRSAAARAIRRACPSQSLSS